MGRPTVLNAHPLHAGTPLPGRHSPVVGPDACAQAFSAKFTPVYAAANMKTATGAGKTKVLFLLIAWIFLHKLDDCCCAGISRIAWHTYCIVERWNRHQ